MAGRSKYTDEDKARVHVLLHANDGNVKRTSRESGIPEQTVRDWKKEWDSGGVPPAVVDALDSAVDSFVGDAVRVRDLYLKRLEELAPEVKNARDAATVIGILDDKVTRAKGLPTSRTEGVVAVLPPAEKVAELFKSYAIAAIEASTQREAEIVESEAVEVE